MRILLGGRLYQELNHYFTACSRHLLKKILHEERLFDTSQRWADLYLPAGFYTLQDTGTKTLVTHPGLTVWSPLIMPFCY